MGDYDDIKRCSDISDTHVIRAVRTRAAMRELLEHVMTIARAGEGGPKVLLAFARMASSSCDWLEGELRVEITDDAGACAIDVLCDLGGGFRERVFPPLEMKVPIDEFIRSVRLVPRMISPLNMQKRGDDRLIFSAREIDESEPPPELVEVEGHEEGDATSSGDMLGSLNIMVEAPDETPAPTASLVPPFAKDHLSEKNKKRPYDPALHAAKTAVRMPKVDKNALRSDVPPPKPRTEPPPTRPLGQPQDETGTSKPSEPSEPGEKTQAKPKKDEELDEGWE